MSDSKTIEVLQHPGISEGAKRHEFINACNKHRAKFLLFLDDDAESVGMLVSNMEPEVVHKAMTMMIEEVLNPVIAARKRAIKVD